MPTMIAYARPSGLIEVGPDLPAEGALPIALGDPGDLHAVLGATAKPAPDGHTRLVPGMQDAEHHGQKVEALTAYADQVAAGLAERGAA